MKTKYSQTWTNDQLLIATTGLQRPPFFMFLALRYLSTTATVLSFLDWSLYTGLIEAVSSDPKWQLKYSNFHGLNEQTLWAYPYTAKRRPQGFITSACMRCEKNNFFDFFLWRLQRPQFLFSTFIISVDNWEFRERRVKITRVFCVIWLSRRQNLGLNLTGPKKKF